jgi:hypothetical protein
MTKNTLLKKIDATLTTTQTTAMLCMPTFFGKPRAQSTIWSVRRITDFSARKDENRFLKRGIP